MAELFGLSHRAVKGRDQEAIWDYTIVGEERLKNTTPFYKEKGIVKKEKMFKDRPIIGRDRKINGGVYVGAVEREAIVVDDKKDPELQEVYQELLFRREQAQAKGKHFKDGILEEVWELVQEIMPYDSDNVKYVLWGEEQTDVKIYLSSFIGGGLCRHQALLIGYLLEKLVEEGRLGGKASIDRNSVPGKAAHVWVRYTNSRGTVFILDAAQRYIGQLDEMSDSMNRWFYERPEDIYPILKPLIRIRRAFVGT